MNVFKNFFFASTIFTVTSVMAQENSSSTNFSVSSYVVLFCILFFGIGFKIISTKRKKTHQIIEERHQKKLALDEEERKNT